MKLFLTIFASILLGFSIIIGGVIGLIMLFAHYPIVGLVIFLFLLVLAISSVVYVEEMENKKNPDKSNRF